jgi:hypothetical protein
LVATLTSRITLPAFDDAHAGGRGRPLVLGSAGAFRCRLPFRFAAAVEEIQASNVVKEGLLFHVPRGLLCKLSPNEFSSGGLYEQISQVDTLSQEVAVLPLSQVHEDSGPQRCLAFDYGVAVHWRGRGL